MQDQSDDKANQSELKRALHLGWVVTTHSLHFYGKFTQDCLVDHVGADPHQIAESSSNKTSNK